LKKGLIIKLNGTEVSAYDPFLSENTKTKVVDQREIDLNGETISVKTYILPNLDSLNNSDRDQILSDGIVESQGFYIYRNKRLIIHGKWFGMRNIDWLSKNLRIKVDIPITLDSIWAIDIKKQNAVLPSIFKRRLVKTIEQSSLIVKATNEFKGRRVNNTDGEYVWDRLLTNGGAFKYAINKNSTYLKTIIKETTDKKLKRLLKELIDETK
jgi:hypothetical protein